MNTTPNRPEQYDEILIGVFDTLKKAAAAKPGALDAEAMSVVSGTLQVVAMFGKDVRRIANALEVIALNTTPEQKSGNGRTFIGMPG